MIQDNLRKLLDQIEVSAIQAGRDPREIALVAVSKERSVEEIKETYFLGIRDFGENRVQEALEKMENLPNDIRWHFLGKLQKNKVNKVIGKFTLIHSVDSVELAKKISSASLEKGIRTQILLEANTSTEASKSGLSAKEWESQYRQLLDLEGIEVHGLMTMAPLTEDEGVIRHCFSELRLLRDRLQELGGEELSALSMGMSNDFPIAIQEGATILRIGTALFTPQ